MSTEFFNDQWRIPSNENQNKISNYSMEFDGSNYVQIGPPPNNAFLQPSEAELNANGFSVSAWIKIDSSFVSNGGIFTNDNHPNSGILYGLEFRLNSNRTLRIDKGDGTGRFGSDLRQATTTETVSLDTWTHVAFVLPSATNTTWQIYINGVASTMTTGGSGGAVSYSSVYSGGIARHRAGFFVGQIDQVSVFDYELSASQVSTLYGGGTAVTNPMSLSPKPISYYQLGDQSVDNGASYLVPNNSLSDYVFNFDGTDDYINAGSASYLNGLSQFSISVWFNLHTAADAKCIISDWNFNTSPFGHFSLRTIDTSGTDYALILYIKKDLSDAGSNAVKTSVIFTENTWYNAVFTYNSGTITCYINGSTVALTTINTIASSLLNQDGILTIGNWTGFSQYWDGQISNTAVFNTQLTSTQVQTIYNNGAPNDISSLSPTAWYKLNAADTFDSSTSTWTINDYGSGGNDGTSSNMFPSNLVVSDLQQTNGYSPYALDFDGIYDYLNCGNDNSLQATTALSISAWIKYTSDTAHYRFIVSRRDSPNTNYQFYLLNTTGGSKQLRFVSNGGVNSTGSVTVNNWHHVAVTANGGNISFYIDGQPAGTGTISGINSVADKDFIIGNIPVAGSFEFAGSISNVALWNTDLSSSEINEIFNEGRPSDLNNFSGTAPVSWWQIGSNSSYDSSAGTWTCLDEIGSNNAVSNGSMTNDDIVDGVGYSASGSGASSIDIKGDAPYSTANGLSENMDVLDRTTDIPS